MRKVKAVGFEGQRGSGSGAWARQGFRQAAGQSRGGDCLGARSAGQISLGAQRKGPEKSGCRSRQGRPGHSFSSSCPLKLLTSVFISKWEHLETIKVMSLGSFYLLIPALMVQEICSLKKRGGRAGEMAQGKRGSEPQLQSGVIPNKGQTLGQPQAGIWGTGQRGLRDILWGLRQV